MRAMASQITNLTIVYSVVYSGTDQGKHLSSASLAFLRGIQRWPVKSPHKGPVTREMFPFDDVIMKLYFRLTGISGAISLASCMRCSLQPGRWPQFNVEERAGGADSVITESFIDRNLVRDGSNRACRPSCHYYYSGPLSFNQITATYLEIRHT